MLARSSANASRKVVAAASMSWSGGKLLTGCIIFIQTSLRCRPSNFMSVLTMPTGCHICANCCQFARPPPLTPVHVAVQVSTKSDVSNATVTTAEAQAVADRAGVAYIATSSRFNQNVTSLFQRLGEDMAARRHALNAQA